MSVIALVYTTDGRNVATVIVDDRVVVKDGTVLTIDAASLYAEVAQITPRLVERAGLKPLPCWPIA